MVHLTYTWSLNTVLISSMVTAISAMNLLYRSVSRLARGLRPTPTAAEIVVASSLNTVVADVSLVT